jgi:antagonist of KipI
MPAGAIDVIDGGFFTTVQDLGRYGYQRYGVPVSGAMDLFALRAANLLVGNVRTAAGLEVTLTGPRLRFVRDTVIAITGANLDPHLDGRPVHTWRPIAAPEGAMLGFGGARDGLRAYIAIAGGIDVPIVLGSRSTFPRAGLGGFQGRAIRSGDCLCTLGDPLERVEGRLFPPEQIPRYGHDHSVRVILGPQGDAFTTEGVAAFLSSTYVVTPKSDRIGCRLDGPQIAHKGSPDIISDGVPFGAVQVAGDGLPIVLVADRGTTGGYTKLATVISADLPRLAQALPGDRVTFHVVSLDEAHRAVAAENATLERVAQSRPIVFARRQLRVSVDDADYTVGLGVEERAAAGTLPAVERDVEVIGKKASATVRVSVADVTERRS